jgi:nitrite reductase/ring-hydroxylating ferredoxin subunit
MYTLRDTPMFTCRSLPLPETLDSLGGPPIAADTALDAPDAEGWTTLLPLEELPPGTTATVYAAGRQVALFNVEGAVYALSNRCSHARGPLSEGAVDAGACEVTCPWHYAKFDLATGHVVDGVANTAVPSYETEVRDGQIRIRERQTKATVEEA